MSVKLVIAGGGLVGSLLSIYLKKRGYQVSILEKRSDPRVHLQDGGRSINLVLTSRGLNALKEVGLAKEALKISVPVTGRMMHSRSGELKYQPYGRDDKECNYSISRLELNQFLLDAAEKEGVEIKFDCSIEEVNLEEKLIFYSDNLEGGRLSYDILFGADGAGSKVRECLKLSSKDFAEKIDFLPSGYKELSMPLTPEGNPAIEKNALHIWPRKSFMLMALANRDGGFTMTFYMPHSGEQHSFESLKDEKRVKAFLQEEFADALPHMPGAVDEFLNNPVGKLGTVRCAPWVFGNSVGLIGDAAHAIVPFFGQGMNSGFEDCFYLSKFLNLFEDDWHKSLSEFDIVQRKNAHAIADMALENYEEMQSKVADDKFLLQKEVERLLEEKFPSMYRSRYGMVTYTLIPYVHCQAIGLIQQEILGELCQSIQTAQEVNFDLAKELIINKLLPFYEKHGLSLERYQLS